MRLRPVASALLLLALAGPVAGARAADPVATSAAPLAQLVGCTAGEAAPGRTATFTGSMAATDATRRMGMRFELRRRLPGVKLATPVAVPGWGGWERADRGRPAFLFTRRVEALAAPAAYTALISFRWWGRGGKVLRTTSRETKACVQPDPRPDLVAGALTATALGDGTARYVLRVHNDGAGAAPAFAVLLSADGGPSVRAAATPLAAGASEDVAVRAPVCRSGEIVSLALDPDGAVDEASERDALLTRPCPL